MNKRSFEVTTPQRPEHKLQLTGYEVNPNGCHKLLLLHGFLAGAPVNVPLLNYLSSDIHAVALNLPGFDDADFLDPLLMTPENLITMLDEVLKELNWSHFSLGGSSLGALLVLYMAARQTRDDAPNYEIDRLIVSSPVGLTTELPEIFFKLVNSDRPDWLLRFNSNELTSYAILEEAGTDATRISESRVEIIAQQLARNDGRELLTGLVQHFMVRNLRNFLNSLKNCHIPTLIISGKKDCVVNPDVCRMLGYYLSDQQQLLINDAGHQLLADVPEAAASAFNTFITRPIVPPLAPPSVVAGVPIPQKAQQLLQSNNLARRCWERWHGGSKSLRYRLRLRRLIDYWSPALVILLATLKVLQFLRFLGLKGEENGWRRITAIFLRKDYSKFALGVFRLRYFRPHPVPESHAQAQNILIHNLYEYLRLHSSLLWAVEPGYFELSRRKLSYCDLVEAEFNSDGTLKNLTAHFDPRCDNFPLLTTEQQASAMETLIKLYNDNIQHDDLARPRRIRRQLNRWIKSNKRFSYAGRIELKEYIDRVTTAAMLHFEYTTVDSNELLRTRLATPDFRLKRHPFWGLLNLVARFTPDLSEVDLWAQFHHVPVDGAPMQELLGKLKSIWGTAGDVMYPALHTPAGRVEILHYGDNIFRARVYADFRDFLKLRQEINQRYASAMGGPATIAGMLIWGLASHPYFRERKFLLPLDTTGEINADHPAERLLGLIFIRPGKYFDNEELLNGFIRFQREFNHRMSRTRMGYSESGEFLDLVALMPAWMNLLFWKLFPESLCEIVGSVGISVIRDADMFVSPITDLQQNGFIAFGKLAVPTTDGNATGAVSICGNREQIHNFIKAIEYITGGYRKFLGLENEKNED